MDLQIGSLVAGKTAETGMPFLGLVVADNPHLSIQIVYPGRILGIHQSEGMLLCAHVQKNNLTPKNKEDILTVAILLLNGKASIEQTQQAVEKILCVP